MLNRLIAVAGAAVLAAAPLAAARKKSPEPLRLSNQVLRVEMAADGTLTVTDKRNRRTWKQEVFGDSLRLYVAKQDSSRIDVQLYDDAHQRVLGLAIALLGERPEIEVLWQGPAVKFDKPVAYPFPFATAKGMWLVVPMNEGILYPVDDAGIKPFQLITYSGHGICMPWYGIVDMASGAGLMGVFLTADDARIDITRREAGPLTIRPLWEPSRGELRYPRRFRYVFFNKGGYVAQAKSYREMAVKGRLFKTLEAKRAENPNVDKLIGAANVWFFDRDHMAMARELKAAGMDYVLWSAATTPENIRGITGLGYLSSRYDIYQDVWPPDAPNLKHDGWPDDLVWLPNGQWMKGWAAHRTAPDGTKTVYQGGVISSPRALARAKEQIPADLKTHPYQCRFIDTTTASPFREDYNPAHPLTRSEDRTYKMALLEFCSRDMKLVTGSETGMDAAVPFVHYFEGMLSLGRYRLPDAGRDMIKYKPPTPDFLKFQVGHYYRVPLWELVYHECVVSQWYWGDYNNKAPEVWDRRDLFNLLYGTPPMFMFNRAIWQERRPRFLQSYRNTSPQARALGYREMLSHEFVTPDHSVQRTRWAGGTEIVVNFGDTSYRLPDGRAVPALGFDVQSGAKR